MPASSTCTCADWARRQTDGRPRVPAAMTDMRVVYAAHLDTPGAQADLATLASIVSGPRRVCLMCFEADYRHCHRSLIVAALSVAMPLDVVNLVPVAALDPD